MHKNSDILESGMARTRTQSMMSSTNCPTSKHLHRFYEPLVLLHVLGRTRGEHTNKELPSFKKSDSFSPSELIRQFVTELCLLCDYEKGGDTVTAIGLEKTPQSYVFWVAANECPKKRIIPFLENLLVELKGIQDKKADLLIQHILEISVSFARSRFKTYRRLLLLDLEKLRAFPDCNDTGLSNGITSWTHKVRSWVKHDQHCLAEFAYDQRHSPFMHRLKTLACEPRYETGDDGLRAVCRSVHHIIGRLGLHCRSAKALVHYTPRMMKMGFLEDSSVQAVPTPQKGIGRPPARLKTTLEGTLSRMLPAGAPEFEKYLQILVEMDTLFPLTEQFKSAYDDPKWKTRVHAETQVLHHFYEHDREFAEGDKYIACSKPACFCCRLYFRYHPGGFVEPHSHQKIYLNWQPPGISQEPIAGRETQLSSILDQMIKDIRTDALRQIISKAPSRRSHPDSVTGISRSMIASVDLDVASNIADGERANEDFADNSSDDSSFSSISDEAAASGIAQLDLDSDTDQEHGGVSLLE